GAAVRLSAMRQPLTCAYCGVLLKTEAEGLTAPTLRIRKSPIPEPPSERRVAINRWLGRVLLGAAAAALPAAPFAYLFLPEGAAAICLAITFHGGLFGLGSWAKGSVLEKEREAVARRVWLREHGEAGRATVLEVIAGEGYEATLRLRVEVVGKPDRASTHKATVPALLVPSLAAGVCLPVVVHPDEPSELEIQWHLV
ncbi:MAG: hypothetical protein AAGA56_23030, partial [Myxococcota bacterium]